MEEKPDRLPAVQVQPELKQQVERFAKLNHVTVSELVRRALVNQMAKGDLNG